MDDQNQKTDDQNLDQTPTVADQDQPAEETPTEQNLEDTEVGETEQEPETSPEEESEETPESTDSSDEPVEEQATEAEAADEDNQATQDETPTDTPQPEPTPGRWYVVHTYSGHENRVSTSLKQRIESEGLSHKIFDILVPTQDKIEIRSGKKETVKEKIFPGYILVKMILDDSTWLAIRTTQGVTSFVGALNKPTPIPEAEVASIVKFMQQGGQPTYKDVIVEGDTVKIIDGPFGEMIGKAEEVDKEKGKVKVLVSIFGRETPVELDFLQVQKL